MVEFERHRRQGINTALRFLVYPLAEPLHPSGCDLLICERCLTCAPVVTKLRLSGVCEMFNPIIGGLLLTFVESLLSGDQICRPIISKGSGCFHSGGSTREPMSLTGMQGRSLGWNRENRQVMLVHFPLHAGISPWFHSRATLPAVLSGSW